VRLVDETVRITEDDEAIRSAVAASEVVPLLVAVAHATGDRSILEPELRPDPTRLLEPDAGLGFAEIDRARALAADALARWRDAGCPSPAPPDETALRALFEFVVGEETDDYFEVLREEVAVDGDWRSPRWRKDDIAPDRDLRVAVIGAGMSGLAAAHRLRQAGVDVVVIDKNQDVGGTWLENTYPGARVDVPSHLYSYSFAQTGEWPQHFSDQHTLLEYFRSCAEHFGLREVIRFGVEVEACEFDDTSGRWRLRLGDGTEEVADIVVSAVGQLNRPLWPDIDGMESFGGQSFHSARWDHSVDLTGKRVGVIGTGASAMQIVPAIAGQPAHLTVFQRTPAWLAPTPAYTEPLSAGVRWLIDHVPGYTRWDSLWQFWKMHEGLLPAAAVDPAWTGEGSVSALNDMVRMLLTMYLQGEFPDPAIQAKVVPSYPPIAKRIVRDDGAWGRALARDDVELVAEPIVAIDESGVKTTKGHHPLDVIVYATGFQASQFLTPMAVTGRDSADLHAGWAGDARAYLGMTVPGFPNLFMLYGPNTNIVINGSIIYFSECEVTYLLDAVRLLLAGDHRTIEVRGDVHDAYNAEVDAANEMMAWGASSVSSWYKNAKGRVSQNWPFSLLEFWRRTRAVDPDDYLIDGA
jgi:4-hydroxyacetophenone monooxygenase